MSSTIGDQTPSAPPSPPAVQAKLAQALALHREGRLAQAETIYAAIVESQPNHVPALHLLGVLAAQTGRLQRGVELMGRAVAIDPQQAAIHSDLGNALRLLARYDEALASYDTAIALQPASAEAIYNRGNTLAAMQRYREAVASYDRAIALVPGLAAAYSNRGAALAKLGQHALALDNYDRAIALQPGDALDHTGRGAALLELGRCAEALASFDTAIALQPDHAPAWAGRGAALIELKRYEEAVASCGRAVALDPGNAASYSNRANALSRLGRHAEALADRDRAIALQPDDAVAWCNHGATLNELRRHEDAVADFDRAIALRPGFAGAYGNRGIALNGLNRPEAAIASYERAIALDPGHADAHYNRGNALMQLHRYAESVAAFDGALAAAPDLPYALGARLHAQMQICDWTGLDRMAGQVTAGVRAGKPVATPFAFLGVFSSPADQLSCAGAYARHRYPAAPARVWTGRRYDHARLRLAYLSGDFRDHAVARLAAELFECHDAARFDVRAYSFRARDADAMHDRLRRAFPVFIPVADRSDAQVARTLAADEIDIAVDLMGYTDGCRPGIFAHRAAPVQVSYLGYPGTSGAGYFDYLIADGTVIPADHEPFYSEKIARLPDSYQANDRRRAIAERTPGRGELWLPERAFVFCCFNNNFKITPPVFDAWMRVLRRVAGSVLWLLEYTPEASANLRREASVRGVDPDRLIFATRMPLPEHLARHRAADLFLDTLPYNAHTTASDALWAGLPVLTCLGEAFSGRVAASLLKAVGLPELIAQNLADYENAAVRLAAAPAELAALRGRLAENRLAQPLFDTDRFTRHIEAAYQTMHERARSGLPPESFSVTPLS